MKNFLISTVAALALTAGAAVADPFADAFANGFAGTGATDFATTYAVENSNTNTGAETYGWLDSAWYAADSSGATGGDSVAFDGGSGMTSDLDLNAGGIAVGGWIVPSVSAANLGADANSAGTGDIVFISHDVSGEVNVDGFDTNWFPDDANADGSGQASSSVLALSGGGNVSVATGATTSHVEVNTYADDGLF